MKILNLKLFLYISLAISSFSKLRAQIDPLGDVFLSSQPIWSHVAIDSSAIGYKGRTGMDFFSGLAEYKILIDQNFAYVVYNNFFENSSGCFIEKIDLNTGKSLWSNFIDLRNSDKRERVKRFFINESGDLELLNLRQSADTLISGINDWLTGKLAIHKYDTASGIEKYVYYSPISDSSYLEFSLDYRAFFNKNKEFGYNCYVNGFSGSTNSLGISRIKMDSLGQFIKIDTSVLVKRKFPNGYFYEDIPVIINENCDTIVRVSHTFKNYPYVSGDSMDLKLHLFNADLGEIASYDISTKVTQVKEYQIFPLRNSIISILSTEYFQDNSAPRRRILTIDPKGELIEEIVFQNRMYQRFGDCEGTLKLRNEPGTLFLAKNNKSDSPRQFNFYKSDGKGNIQLVLEVPMKNTYNFSDGLLKQLDDDNVLLSARYRRGDADPRVDLYSTERFITTLWDAKKLGILTTTKSTSSKLLNISISPNPAVTNIRIEGLENKKVSMFIYNELGSVVLQNTTITSEDQISIQHLIPGRYFIELVDSKNQLLYAGQFLKVSP